LGADCIQDGSHAAILAFEMVIMVATHRCVQNSGHWVQSICSFRGAL